MTDAAPATSHPHHRRPRQLLPGPADGAHPRIREAASATSSPSARSDNGSRTDIPKWIEKAGHRLISVDQRDGYDEIVVEKRAEAQTMNRILILGGGVGGTLAPTSSRAAQRRIDARRGDVTLVDETGAPRLPAGLHVHRDGRRARRAPRSDPSARCSTRESTSWSARSTGIDEADANRSSSTTASACAYDQLVLATGSRIVPEAIEHFADGGAPLLHRRCGAAGCGSALDAFTGGRIVIGIAGDALQVPAGAARGRVPHRGRAARARPARRERDPLLLAHRARLHHRVRLSDMATPILEEKGIELHTFFNVETIDPERKVVSSLEGEELPYDLLILVPPHRASSSSSTRGSRRRRAAGCRPIAHTLRVGGRPNVFALGDATDLPLSKAGSTAHFEAPVVAEGSSPRSRAASPPAARAPTTAR